MEKPSGVKERIPAVPVKGGKWHACVSFLRAHKNAWVVFLFLVLVYAYFYHEPGYNGGSRLGLTAAIVEESRLTIDTFHQGTGFATGDKAVYNGHFYSDKAIGSSLLAVPPYAAIYWGARMFGYRVGTWLAAHLLTFLAIGIPSALAGALIYAVCEMISGNPLRAGVVTAAVTLGSLAFPFSLIYFGHQLAASLLWFSFFLIFRLRFMGQLPPPWYILLIGFLLSFALVTEYTTALVVLPLVGYLIYVLWPKGGKILSGVVGYAGLGGLLPILLMIGYNILVYGQPLVNGYQYEFDPYFLEAMSHGIMGIGLPNLTVLFFETFQPAMGLFWQSPVLLLIFPGAFFILRDRFYRVEGILALFISIVYLVVTSGYFQWWGGYSAGPRHIIPMLPFLCLPLIFLPRRAAPWLAGLMVISVFQMLIIAASRVSVPDEIMWKFSEFRFFEYSVIYSVCLPEILKGSLSWNFGLNVLDLGDWTSFVPVVLVIAGMFFYLWRASLRLGNLNAFHELPLQRI